jgi:hypothetical protein
VHALAGHHVDGAPEHAARGAAVRQLPHEGAAQESRLEVELPLKFLDDSGSQIQLLIAHPNAQLQRVRAIDHEAQAIRDASIARAVRHVFLVETVEIGALQAIAAVRFLEAAAKTEILVAQAKEGFADAAVLRVEALLHDPPRIYLEITVAFFLHVTLLRRAACPHERATCSVNPTS